MPKSSELYYYVTITYGDTPIGVSPQYQMDKNSIGLSDFIKVEKGVDL